MDGTSKKRDVFKGICIFIGVVVLAVVCAFALYKSEPQYVKNEKGENYIDANGNPEIYYKDLFGRTFIYADGLRLYVAKPTVRYSRPVDINGNIITTEPITVETDSTVPSTETGESVSSS